MKKPLKTYSKFNLIIRSAIFLTYTWVSVMLMGLVMLFSWLLPLYYRHAILRTYLTFSMNCLRWICHINYDVKGLEHIAKIKNGIVLAKHQSAWETFYLPIIFHTPAIILKRELFWLPFFGCGLGAIDPIAINRHNRTSAMQQIIKKGKARLDDGRWILIFPEGTRVPYGQVGYYKLGGARLAAETGYPVIPVAHNAGRYWPKRQFIKQPGTIKLVIGPPIQSKGREADAILAEAKDWIESTIAHFD